MYPNSQPIDLAAVQAIVAHIFPSSTPHIEHVAEGVSTHVYRIISRNETFYLRILPEVAASFAPEVAAHTQLRRLQVNVPEVIYFEHYNEIAQCSLMVTTEIKGRPLSQSQSLETKVLHTILREAGRDLARINSLSVAGFGWILRDAPDTEHLHAQWADHRSFALEYWKADLAYLGKNVLSASEIKDLEHILVRYHSWLDVAQAHLAHGDFDVTHIYQENGLYSGIIDFGEIRGTGPWYDLGHFHMREGEQYPTPLLPPLISGYKEIYDLPPNYEQMIRLGSILINVRILARVLQKRPSYHFAQNHVQTLREDIAALL